MNNDIIVYVCSFINNEEKVKYLSLCHKNYSLIKQVYFNDRVRIFKAKQILPKYRFTNILWDLNLKQEIKEGNAIQIPNSVKYLTFGWYFNQEIKDCIPISVTYLTFFRHFPLEKRKDIPKSILKIIFC